MSYKLLATKFYKSLISTYLCNSFLGFLALDFTKRHIKNLHYLQILVQLPLLSKYVYFVAYEYIRTRTVHYMYSVQWTLSPNSYTFWIDSWAESVVQDFQINANLDDFIYVIYVFLNCLHKIVLTINKYCSHCEACCTLGPLKMQLSSKSGLFSLHKCLRHFEHFGRMSMHCTLRIFSQTLNF
jgi:hypothetical protein